MLRAGLISCTALAALAACDKGEKVDPPPVATQAAPVVTPPEPKPTAKLVKSWGKQLGFSTPESVLHDESADLYLVSNVEGKPLAKDGKAFISKVAPEADGMELKWIEGGKKGVTLNAPKGMVFAGDLLVVADIDTVRLFNRKDGTPAGEVPIPGATFLNDVVAMPDGRVLVSDTGMKDDGSGGLAPAGNDAIYVFGKDRKVTTYAKSKDLNNPNGLAYTDRLYAVTFGSTELYSVDVKTGAKAEPLKFPSGTLDGLVVFSGEYFVSSWEAKAIYRGRIGAATPPAIAIDNIKSPADMAYDKRRKRLVIPLFEEDEIRAYTLP